MSGSAGASVIREFLVRLAYQVDGSSSDKFDESVEHATKNVLKLGAAAEAAAGAVFAFVTKMADSFEQLYFMSLRTKATVAGIQAIGFAASQMGSSVGAARASLEGLAEFMRSSPGAGGLLKALGVDPNQDTSKIMQALGARFKQMPYYMAKQYAGMMGIDERTLQALIRGVGQFSNVYQDMLQKAGVNSEAAAKAGHDFMVQLRTLFAALDILAQKVALRLMKDMGGDIQRLRILLVDNFGRITDAIVAGTKIILSIADVIVVITTRVAQAFQDLSTWFSGLNKNTKDTIYMLGVFLLAWRVLNSAFLMSPLGAVIALGLALVALYDDWKTWKAGGQHIIDWEYWDPEIRKAIERIKNLWDAISPFLPEFNRWQEALAAIAIYVSGKWALTLIAAFGKVGIAAGRAFAPILVIMTAIDLWNKAHQDMGFDKLPIGSPLWNNVPEDIQRRLPNSPYNQSRHPTPDSGWDRWTPSGIYRRLFGGNKGNAKSDVDTSIPPEGRAFLDVTGANESNGDYAVEYGGDHMANYDDHPGNSTTLPDGTTTSAAGKYQFEKGTWEEAKKALNLPDFSPASQDKAAWWLAQRDYNKRTGRDLLTDLKSKDPAVLAGIGSALHSTWTSLGGSPAFAADLQQRLKVDTARTPDQINKDAASRGIRSPTTAKIPPNYKSGQGSGVDVPVVTPDGQPYNPGPMPSNTPMPQGLRGGSSSAVSIAPTTHINVQGVRDPAKAASLIEAAQRRTNTDLMRNVRSRVI